MGGRVAYGIRVHRYGNKTMTVSGQQVQVWVPMQGFVFDPRRAAATAGARRSRRG